MRSALLLIATLVVGATVGYLYAVRKLGRTKKGADPEQQRDPLD